METINKHYWGNYEFPLQKMVTSVIFPPEYNTEQRIDLLERVYGKSHRVEPSKTDLDRYYLTPIPLSKKTVVDESDYNVISQFYNNSLKNKNANAR